MSETFDPEQRRREKQASRDADEQALASGEKTREQVRRENGAFAFPNVRIIRTLKLPPKVIPFEPDWVSPPGDTIQDMLTEQGLTSEWLATALGIPIAEVSMLLTGDKAITEDIAHLLSITIGHKPDFWLRRESNYRRDLERLSKNRCSKQ